jgi:hypothetical protein
MKSKNVMIRSLYFEILLDFEQNKDEPHSVVLPYNYWSQEKWLNAFETLGLTIGIWNKNLGLYPPPASWIFERSLHFIARLELN